MVVDLKSLESAKRIMKKCISSSSAKPGLAAARDVGLTNLAEDGRSY
jgi:hypothetical protein